MAESPMRGDSQLVRRRQVEVSRSGTPQRSARRSRGIELATFRLPTSTLYLLSHVMLLEDSDQACEATEQSVCSEHVNHHNTYRCDDARSPHCWPKHHHLYSTLRHGKTGAQSREVRDPDKAHCGEGAL